MPLIDIYTDRNEPAGYCCEKAEAHANGLWHRVFTLLVINSERHTAFLQRKNPGRYSFDRPDYLEVTVGGHYEAGEMIEDGIREAKEEIGHCPPFSELVSLGQRQTSVVLGDKYDNREFQHIFLWPTVLELSDFSPADDEVSAVVEVPLEQGLELMRGEIPALSVKMRHNNGTRNVDITREDFVPDYLKTDAFMIRLFIAAQRFLRGDNPEDIYW